MFDHAYKRRTAGGQAVSIRIPESIRLVLFLYRFCTADFRFLASAPLLVACYLFALVNFFEYICDHWRCSGTSMNLAADVALVNGRKCILRLVGRQKPGEPCCCTLLVLWSPLCGTGLS